MNIPREFIDQLLARIDVVDLINSFVPLRKKSGNNYFACCPFHNEKSASFSVSQAKQFYHCFGCGAHGNAIDFFITHEHHTFPEAIEALAQIAGLAIPQDEKQTKSQAQTQLPALFAIMQEASLFYYEQMRTNPRAIQYLQSRGINGDIAKCFQIGFAPASFHGILNHFAKNQGGQKSADKALLQQAGLIIKKDQQTQYYDRFRDRIMFPIRDNRGRVIGFGGRILDQGEPKYLNSPETPLFQKGRELYGLYETLKVNRHLKSLLIVEGYMDVIALFQHGINNVVATLGTATTATHLSRLFRYAKKIIFCFDGDSAGRTAAWRALQVALPLLRDEIEIRFLFLPDGEDPDSFVRKQGKVAFEKQLKEASLTLSHFLFQTLSIDNDLATVEGRALFATAALQYIQKMPAGVYHDMLLAELAKRARIESRDLQQRLTQVSKMGSDEKPAKLISKVNVNANVNANANAAYASSNKIAKLQIQSPMRLAITLLIHHPELISIYQTHHLAESALLSTQAGGDFFAKLIEIIQQDPHINAGRLMEYFRGEKEEPYIAALLKRKTIIPEEGVKHEFEGALQQLHLLILDAEINQLLAKAAQNSLSQSEKELLSRYINQKKAANK